MVEEWRAASVTAAAHASSSSDKSQALKAALNLKSQEAEEYKNLMAGHDFDDSSYTSGGSSTFPLKQQQQQQHDHQHVYVTQLDGVDPVSANGFASGSGSRRVCVTCKQEVDPAQFEASLRELQVCPVFFFKSCDGTSLPWRWLREDNFLEKTTSNRPSSACLMSMEINLHCSRFQTPEFCIHHRHQPPYIMYQCSIKTCLQSSSIDRLSIRQCASLLVQVDTQTTCFNSQSACSFCQCSTEKTGSILQIPPKECGNDEKVSTWFSSVCLCSSFWLNCHQMHICHIIYQWGAAALCLFPAWKCILPLQPVEASKALFM